MKQVPDADLTRLIRRLARRLNRAVWLNRVLFPLSIVLTTCGTFLLLFKMTAPEYRNWAFLVLALVPAVIYAVYQVCRRKNLFFNEYETVEVIDHLYRNDGSVTAVFERPQLAGNGSMGASLEELVSLPRIDPAHYVKRLVLPLLFLAVAAVIPPRPAAARQQRQEIMAGLTNPLLEKLEAGAELIPEEEREQLMENVKEMQAKDDGVSREQWEAVEEIEQRIENAVQENEARAAQMATSLSNLAEMVSQQAGDSSNLGGDPENQAEMDKLLADLSIKAKDPKMPLNSAQRSALAKALGQCKGKKRDANCSGSLCKLASELESLCKGGNCTGNGPNPGRGGISRGRADAPLVFGDEKFLEGAKMEDKQLENQFLAPEDLVDLGIIPIEPKVEPGKFSPGALRDYGEQQGTQVSRTEISPSQKDVVARYFAR